MTYRMMALGTMMSASLVAPIAAHAQSASGKDDRDQQAGYVELVRPRTHERVLFNIGVGYTPPFLTGYTDETTAGLRGGSTKVTIDYDLRYAVSLETGAVVMLNRSWGAGLTVLTNYFENGERTMALSALNQSQDGSFMRKETAANLELTYVLLRREGQQDPFDPYTDRGTGYVIRVIGGPAYYRAKQDAFTFRPTGKGLEELKHEGTGWGYHAGLDVAMYTSIPGLGGGGIGFGGTFRYGGGSVKLPGLDEPSNRSAGGLNISYTIRFRL